MEIKRKFLIKEMPNLINSAYREIEQLYISYEPEIRIIKRDSSYFIIQESVSDLSRIEIRTEINEATFEILKNLSKGRKIEKTRYLVCDSGNIFELDRYHGDLEGLVTVELDFLTEEETSNFSPPFWFGEEITSNPDYKNKSLSSINESSIKKIISNKHKIKTKKQV